MTEKVEKLKQLLEEDSNDTQLINSLIDVKDECDSDVAKRILAAQCGLYNCLITFLASHTDVGNPLKVAVFECLIALMTGKSVAIISS